MDLDSLVIFCKINIFMTNLQVCHLQEAYEMSDFVLKDNSEDRPILNNL